MIKKILGMTIAVLVFALWFFWEVTPKRPEAAALHGGETGGSPLLPRERIEAVVGELPPVDLKKVAEDLGSEGQPEIQAMVQQYSARLKEFDEVETNVQNIKKQLADLLTQNEDPKNPEVLRLQDELEDGLKSMRQANERIGLLAKTLSTTYLDYAMAKYGIERVSVR